MSVKKKVLKKIVIYDKMQMTVVENNNHDIYHADPIVLLKMLLKPITLKCHA